MGAEGFGHAEDPLPDCPKEEEKKDEKKEEKKEEEKKDDKPKETPLIKPKPKCKPPKEEGKGEEGKKEEGKPMVYRIHDVPNEDKLNSLSQFVNKFGYNVSLIVNTHNVPADRVNIIKQRL